MAQKHREFSDYRTALILSYDEEISGEAYFERLATFFAGRSSQALLLLARIERVTAAAIRPLLDRHGFVATDHSRLRADGLAEANRKSGVSWQELVEGMAVDFPAFVEEFEQVERLAPASDRELIRVLTDHEVAGIEFARREVTADPRSLDPLKDFLKAYENS